MTIQEINERIDEIAARAGDPDAAHNLEDELLYDVLRYIAQMNNEAGVLALAAIQSKTINFSRWTA